MQVNVDGSYFERKCCRFDLKDEDWFGLFIDNSWHFTNRWNSNDF